MPKILKHFMFLVPVLDDEAKSCLVPTLDNADFPCGDCVDGLDELPLSFLDLLVQFWLKVLEEFLLAAFFLFSSYSIWTALCGKSSNSMYSCNSTTSLMSGFRPLRKRAIVSLVSSSMFSFTSVIFISL